ncbi:MAG: riboflavin biosynthesis protein RibD [SAR202 cluster bacterium]|nr:riboflavin biosynthesis protein RibD [SAR202 cluster bacterium]
MGKVVLGTTMSVDGYINDRNGSVDALYTDFEMLQASEPMKESIRNTGAAVMGRNTFGMSPHPEWYNDNYEYQAPIFVLTHKPPSPLPRTTGDLSFTFVTDGIESAVRQAKAAAGDKDVTIIAGASVARQALLARLADELHIDVMPVLLGGGLRMFDGLAAEIRLERLAVVEVTGARTHLRYRVVR